MAKKPLKVLIAAAGIETSYQEQDVFEYFDDIYDYGMGFLYDDNDKVSRIFLYLGL